MSSFIDKREIEALSIVDFLARLGYTRKFRSGAEYFYESMLRDDDHSPSFSVNDAKGTWIDRGKAQLSRRGGGIVQLGAAIWPDLSFVEVLNEIKRVFDGARYIPPQTYTPHQRDKPEPEHDHYRYSLWDARTIGRYQPINDYLESRGLMEVAAGKLSEVYFRDRKQPNNPLPFFAIGWPNEHGNWEFSRLDGRKSSIGQKGISVIPGGTSHALVFEGYFDYLSHLRYDPEPEHSPTVIILNGVGMLHSAVERLQTFTTIDAYLDRDAAGYECLQELLTYCPQVIDRSSEYNGFKDYNEKLQADLGITHTRDINPGYRLGR